MRVKMIVAYDGTNYCGWQIQPNGITIEPPVKGGYKGDRSKPHRCRSAFTWKCVYV